jgi:uncharacterized protein (DUF1697 family)
VTHVAFLRALNVGGKGVVKMADVKAAFERAGCRDVRTFIASGNVLFTPTGSVPAQQRKIVAAMRELMGAKTDICFRTLADIDALIAADPFGDHASDERAKLYVAFLDRAPSTMPPLPHVDVKEACEIIGMTGRDVFIVSRPKPKGLAYGFPTFFVERLGCVCTARNWNTVVRLAAFARQPDVPGLLRETPPTRAKTPPPATPSSRADRGAAARRGGRAGNRSRAS